MPWVLGSDNEKRLRQGEGPPFRRDLPFFHGFQQCALRLRCGPINFISQYKL